MCTGVCKQGFASTARSAGRMLLPPDGFSLRLGPRRPTAGSAAAATLRQAGAQQRDDAPPVGIKLPRAQLLGHNNKSVLWRDQLERVGGVAHHDALQAAVARDCRQEARAGMSEGSWVGKRPGSGMPAEAGGVGWGALLQRHAHCALAAVQATPQPQAATPASDHTTSACADPTLCVRDAYEAAVQVSCIQPRLQIIAAAAAARACPAPAAAGCHAAAGAL